MWWDKVDYNHVYVDEYGRVGEPPPFFCDVTGYIIGWKVLTLRGPYVGSPRAGYPGDFGYIWKNNKIRSYGVPKMDNKLGIYGCTDPRNPELDRYRNFPEEVIACCYFWGETVIMENGVFRSEFAEMLFHEKMDKNTLYAACNAWRKRIGK